VASPGVVAPTLDVGAPVATGELSAELVEVVLGPSVPDSEVDDCTVVSGTVNVLVVDAEPSGEADSTTESAVSPVESSSPPDTAAMITMMPTTPPQRRAGSSAAKASGLLPSAVCRVGRTCSGP
jgi:hypothetical protein